MFAFTWQRGRRWLLEARAWAHRRPARALAICAIASAVAASYPVVFFGMSFVSPNSGTALLYEHAPTVPGLEDTRPEHVRGADVAAMMWAHLPYTVMQGRALREEGVLPLWNRYNSCGVPLLGQGQSMMGDPLNLIVALTGGKSWAFDLKYVLCKALFAGGLGWCVWLLTRDLAAAGIITVASAFVAFFNFRVNHAAIFSVSYSPWVLVGWLQLARAGGGRTRALALTTWFAANWMLLSSGTAKEASALLLALNATGAAIFLVSPIAGRAKLRLALGVALAGMALLLASAPVWWTFAETLAVSRTMYDAPVVFQASRAWLIGLFDDLFYIVLAPWRNVYAPAANFLILYGCLWAIVQPARLLSDRAATVVLAGTVGAISLAFAWVPTHWIAAIPVLRNVHHLEIHFSCVAVVLAALLAGWGFAAARARLAGPFWLRHGLPIAALVMLMFWVYFRHDPAPWTAGRGFSGWLEMVPRHVVTYAHVVLLPLALVVLTLAAARRVRRQKLSAAIAGGAIVALVVLLGRHGQHLSWGATSSYVRFPGARADLSARSPALDYLANEVSPEPARVIGTRYNLMTGFMAIHGLESLNGPDAVFSRHHRELLDAAEMVPPDNWFVFLGPESAEAWRPMLDFFNVRFVVAPPGTELPAETFHRVASLDLDVFRSTTHWPRAFFTNQLASYHTAADLAARVRNQPAGRPLAATQANDDTAPAGAEAFKGEPIVVPAAGYRLTSNRTAFSIDAPAPGFAILHETWWPDSFEVTLDGRRVPYFRVNHAFKGITIPSAGIHHVEFVYRPPHLWLTLGLAIGGVLLFPASLLVVRPTPSASKTG